jgi:tRNA/rRNA methyltransferase
MTGAPPVVVLVRPQLGQNIGMAVRAMANCGLTELRLVAPRDGWPNDDARQAAAGTEGALDAIATFDSLADAVADLHRLYATTVRPRGQVKRVLTPTDAAGEIRGDPDRRAGLLFGPERTGLENDEVALADRIVTAPLNPEAYSLNLSQAVLLMAWEWWRPAAAPQAGATPPSSAAAKPSTKAELEGFLGRLERALDASDFFTEPQRRPTTWRNIRNIFTRHDLTRGEVDTLHGILSALRAERTADRRARDPDQDGA